jgi:hypothetical protein
MRKMKVREGELESNADEHTLMERFGAFYTDIICGRKEQRLI